MEDQKKQQLIRLGQVIRQLRCGYNTDTKRSMISAIENGKTDLTTSKKKKANRPAPTERFARKDAV